MRDQQPAWAAVARREWLALRRDRSLRLGALALFAVLGVTAAYGLHFGRQQAREHSDAQQLTQAQFFEQSSKNPHNAAHFGTYAYRPLHPLSLIEPGLTPGTGAAIFLQPHKRDEPVQRPALARPAELASFAPWTVSLVLQTLVPLLLVLLLAPSIAGERERGTLRLMLASGLTPAALVAGKLLAAARLVGLLAAPALAVVAMALVWGGGASLSLDMLWRAGLLLLAYLPYWFCFMAVALAVSCLARSAQAALVGGVAFWLLACVAAPPLAAGLAGAVIRPPTTGEFREAVARDITQGLDGHHSEDQRAEALKRETLARYGVRDTADLPVSFEGVVLEEGEHISSQVYAKHYAALHQAYLSQAAVVRGAGLVSPTLLVRDWSQGMAATGLAELFDFADAAEHHRVMQVQALNRLMTEKAGRLGYDYQTPVEAWRSIPAFAYQTPGVGWSANRAMSALLGLLAWAMAAAAVLWAAAARLPRAAS